MPRAATRAAAIPAENSPARLSGAEACRVVVRLYGTATGSLAAALGRIGAGRWQTLGHDRIRDRLQLAATDGKLGRSLAPLLAARIFIPIRPPRPTTI